MTQKFRFIKLEHGKKRYAESPRDAVGGLIRRRAALFTDDDHREWGKAGGWIMEPVGEDEATAAKPGGAAGVRPLPGLD